jgi:hypothetical protein
MNAIANGNWIGYLPQQFASANMSRSEEQAAALVILNIYLTTVISNDAKVIHSHHYVIKNPEPIMRSIQNDIQGFIRFTLVGCNVTEALALVRKRFPLRVDLVRAFLSWLDNNNDLYKRNVHQLDEGLDEALAEANYIVDRTSTSEHPVSAKLVRIMQFSTSTYNSGTADDAQTGASSSSTARSMSSTNDATQISSQTHGASEAAPTNDMEEISHHHMIVQPELPSIPSTCPAFRHALRTSSTLGVIITSTMVIL